MVYPVRMQSKEAAQNALFDYLNINRHKFDENGNFDARPDERDYFPLVLAKSPPPTFTWGPGGPEMPKKPSRSWLQLNDPKNWNKQNDELYERRRDVEYEREECDEHLADAKATCRRRWLRTDIRIPKEAYRGCIDRAKWLWSMCNQRRGYPLELKEWGWTDNGIDDVEDYLNGGPAPNEVRPESDEEEPEDSEGQEYEAAPSYNRQEPLEDVTSLAGKGAAELSLLERILKAIARGGGGIGGGGMGLGGGGRFSLHPKERHMRMSGQLQQFY